MSFYRQHSTLKKIRALQELHVTSEPRLLGGTFLTADSRRPPMRLSSRSAARPVRAQQKLSSERGISLRVTNPPGGCVGLSAFKQRPSNMLFNVAPSSERAFCDPVRVAREWTRSDQDRQAREASLFVPWILGCGKDSSRNRSWANRSIAAREPVTCTGKFSIS